MTTMRAVAKHRVDADKSVKRRELRDGLEQVVYALLELGVTLSDIESAVECGMLDYESDHPGLEADT